MKHFSEQFYTAAQKVKLSPEERGQVRERVLAYMELHPLPQPEAPVAPVSVFSYFKYWRQVSAAFVLLLAAVPFAAEQSLPGDVLYPLKVRVNEEVRGYLANTPHEEIAWQTERIERRIAEAKLLAEEGKLTPQEEEDVANAIESYSTDAQASIAALQTTDSEEASLARIAFASALEVQADSLNSTNGADNEPQHKRLSAAVTAVSSEAKAAAAETETPSVEKLLARIEQESTAAEELFVTISAEATAEESAKIKDRLSAISRKVEKAKSLESGATTSVTIKINGTDTETAEANAVLRAALGDVRKLISFMTTIDVRADVSVDAFVPDDGEGETATSTAATTTPTTTSDATTTPIKTGAGTVIDLSAGVLR